MNESSQRTKQLASLAFIILIGVVFALQFGPGSRGCDGRLQTEQEAATVAVVNRREITTRDFARAYANQAAQYQGQGLTNDILKQLGVPKSVLDSLVNNELIAQDAEANGITASDEELRELLFSVPMFQRDGVFNAEVYQQNVRGFMGKSATDFETELRRSLAAQKQQELILGGAIVSEDEVRARYQREGNTANLSYVRFLPAMFADQVAEPTAAQLAAFEATHADGIKAQYDANASIYAEAEKVQARQILIALPEGASDADRTAAKERASALRTEITGGKDFAAAAREASDDQGTREQGGELGWVERGAFTQELSDAVFGLEVGGVTEPILTQYGFHLVKVEGKRPASTRALAEVSSEIARSLYKKEEAQKLARAAADKALADAKAGRALTELFPAPEAGATPSFGVEADPEARSTGVFTASATSVPGLMGDQTELLAATFKTGGPALLDQVFEIGDALVVAQVTERAQPSDEAFAQQQDALREEAREAKKIELRDTYVEQLRQRANITINQQSVDAAIGG